MKHNHTTGAGNKDLTTDSTEPATAKEASSSLKRLGKISLASVALALLGITGSSSRGDDGKHSETRWTTIVIDVAEDARTAVPSLTDPAPKRGTTLIVNGKIYPGGMIPTGDGFDVDTTGSIGAFVTRGTFNFDLSQAFSGGDPLISSTDHYLFSPTGGLNVEDSLMSEGQDSIIGTTHRVVLGGTGIYRGTIGEVKVEVLGRNSTGFADRRLTFQIRTPE